MSNKLLKPPLIEETTDDVENTKKEAGSEWDTMSNLGLPSEGRRDSVHLSVVSGDSRRQSLFTEEDLLALDDEDSESSKDEDEGDDRKRKQDEIFVDKARAAMVVSGTKDIKDALERQKAVEISRRTPEAKVSHILFHQAKFLMSQGRFKEALLFINRALNTDAECKEWLTEKSRCYLNLFQPEIALQYIDHVLKKDPHFFKALVLKGEILYSMWDLEKSMLFFVEGRRQRPENVECIRGIHKVKMALEEIAAYRVSADKTKKKSSKNRSKSAKGRLTSTPSIDSLLRNDQKHSPSNHRPPSRMSTLSEDSRSTLPSTTPSPDIRPTTGHRRMESPSISRSQKSEIRTSAERPPSPKGKRGTVNRPKTALNRRSRSKSTSRDLEIEDICRFIKESMSGSYKSSTLRRFSGNTQRSSDHSGFSSRSISSSMEDISRESRHQFNRSKSPKLKNRSHRNQSHQLSKITPGTKVSTFLGQDKMFLDSLLKKDFKQSHTVYTKRALKIAREVQNFVTEREKYWKNRENFTRYTTTDEDTLI